MNPTKHSPLARRIVVHAALNNKALRDGLSNYDLLRLCIEMNAMDLRTAKRAAPAGPPTRQRRRVVQYKGGAVR